MSIVTCIPSWVGDNRLEEETQVSEPGEKWSKNGSGYIIDFTSTKLITSNLTHPTADSALTKRTQAGTALLESEARQDDESQQ